MPYALREKVKNVSQKRALLSPIHFADCASPKKDGTSLRVCGYFKVSINQVSKLNKYPAPNIDDLLAQLARGKRFMKLDISQAYQGFSKSDEEPRQWHSRGGGIY